MTTSMRLRLLRAAGATIDPGAFVEAGISVVAGRISIGARSYINRQCLLDARGGIEIGENTLVGPRVSFLTATHPVMPDTPRAGPVVYESITVGSNAWIGAAATLLPGCEVGDGCVVAAGSIVRGKLAPNTLHAGVPAVCKRSLAPLTPQLAQAG